MVRYYYSASLTEFCSHSADFVLGQLARYHQHDLESNQKRAWLEQIQLLREQLVSFSEEEVQLFFEFSIPRMGKRADVVLVLRGVVFILEFKVGAKAYLKSDIRQSVDYALDLKNFHEGSHKRILVPVLVATEADNCLDPWLLSDDQVCTCLTANRHTLLDVIQSVLDDTQTVTFDPLVWANSRYKPTPTIVQAAQALYQGHDVADISRSDSGAENLTVTANCIAGIIERAKKNHEKAICFVTGVPGAGKTLAGLNIANSRMNAHEDEHAVFLSGNGPLVDVLREALARDEYARCKIPKKEAMRKACTFIQNIHHFRDDNLLSTEAPIEKVVVFDEAQRAWDKDHASNFMRRKKGVPDFNQSEPEYLISVMDRHKNWCVIVCLIGGGQEINNGEAGLFEWFTALKNSFSDWFIYHSSQTLGSEYTWSNESPVQQIKGLKTIEKAGLHLAVSIRSFRAEKLSAFIHAVVHNQPEQARELFKAMQGLYPILLSRNLQETQQWLHNQGRGNELYGLVSSSGAIRLKPEGLNVKAKIEAVKWFLNGKDDIRACQYLEDVATEFDVQGLELDWTGVCWDADLRYKNGQWQHHKFKGTKWQNVIKQVSQRYLENAYRVLLSRARQGIVIFIPRGNEQDDTRLPAFYDQTFAYLQACGIPSL